MKHNPEKIHYDLKVDLEDIDNSSDTGTGSTGPMHMVMSTGS